MATVTHYIHSHYNPEERELLEEETGQRELYLEEANPDETWQREAPKISHRLQLSAPRFVSATVPYDEWSTLSLRSSNIREQASNLLGQNLSGWYRSLTNNQSETSSSNPRAKPLPSTHSEPTVCKSAKEPESRNKNNWFIMNAIKSEPTKENTTLKPTLADILVRDPPPLPLAQKYTPPVFLEIGPSNKGFGLLQRSGWNEGEPLGPDVVRRKPVVDFLQEEEDMLPVRSKWKRNLITSPTNLRREAVEVKLNGFDDVSEIKQVDVIDLTAESDSYSEDVDSDEDPEYDVQDVTPIDNIDNTPYARKALLTPIATVLKSDRLGIGLKAKTVGPYKASLKRVTHNAAAMASHVNAAEESRKLRKLFGRGRRGFEKQHRKEEELRKSLLHQLKS